MTIELSVARQFSAFPFGRYPDHGPHNGERFRKELLIPALQSRDKHVVVDLAGARGLAPSFLEEAFGGLVREGFDVRELEQRLIVRSDMDPSYIAEVWSYIRDAARLAHH